jgi:phage terminase Nu1 subunit (DNA packaging protein)
LILDLRASCLRLVGMDTDIPSADLQRLLGVARTALNDLAKRGIVKRGDKRGTFVLETSVTGYCNHLRNMASARGGEDAVAVRTKLASAQADLAAEKVNAMRGETLPTAEVEGFWRGKLRTFRNRILAIPNRVRDLTPNQNVVLTRELRDALTELAHEAAT